MREFESHLQVASATGHLAGFSLSSGHFQWPLNKPADFSRLLFSLFGGVRATPTDSMMRAGVHVMITVAQYVIHPSVATA